MRYLSSLGEERKRASQLFDKPAIQFNGDRAAFIELVRKALYASKICSYAQGFAQMKLASDTYEWNLNCGSIAMIFRGGCIIRAQFLDKIKDAFQKDASLPNLLLDDYFRAIVNEYQSAWREVVAIAAMNGVTIPAFSAALAYFDAYRTEYLPANLLQAQRDYFGAHTFERLDKPGSFHFEWNNE
ncbi:6-phosphogluconate dehydrogenase, decarboxylating [compost metagenome]